MLTGVGMFEVELVDGVRSCLGPWAVCIGEVSGAVFPMVYGDSKLGMLVLMFIDSGA